jgi:hypothetical protein
LSKVVAGRMTLVSAAHVLDLSERQIRRLRYADFGPTLAAEKLAERDGLRVSRETLRGWMSEAGLWLSRKQAADVPSAAAAA